MIKFLTCVVCSDGFTSKEQLINHLKGEIEKAKEQALNCEEDADEAEYQLEELQEKV